MTTHTIEPDDPITQGTIRINYVTLGEIKIDSPYKAKDDIKSLDPDETGRRWDSRYWRADLEAVVDISKHLVACGYILHIDSEVVEAFQREHPEKAMELA